MHGRIFTVQCPLMQPDETVSLLGVRDANFCNIDHVPVWYESVGNYYWGEGQWMPHHETVGKDNNHFTVQLCIIKNGDKLIPFIIFKGEPKS